MGKYNFAYSEEVGDGRLVKIRFDVSASGVVVWYTILVEALESECYRTHSIILRVGGTRGNVEDAPNPEISLGNQVIDESPDAIKNLSLHRLIRANRTQLYQALQFQTEREAGPFKYFIKNNIPKFREIFVVVIGAKDEIAKEASAAISFGKPIGSKLCPTLNHPILKALKKRFGLGNYVDILDALSKMSATTIINNVKRINPFLVTLFDPNIGDALADLYRETKALFDESLVKQNKNLDNYLLGLFLLSVLETLKSENFFEQPKTKRR